MKAYWKYLIIGAAIVVSAWLLARAYTYKYHAQETIVVTGLGETEFSSDLIVWNGFITAEAQNVEAGYAQIESSKKKVYDYLLSKGIAAEAVVFQFVNVTKQYEPVYSANGSWAGQRFTGYRLSQGFTVESKSVDAVENVSREISSLIAQGVSIEAMQPDYYYTKARRREVVAHRESIGRCPCPCREDRGQCRSEEPAEWLRPVWACSDHGCQYQRGVLGRRIVQHLEPAEKARITMRVEYRIK